MKYKYTIITTNYNGFHLMTKYFDCLENQTFKDFEVIIIDDCSTDDSFDRLNRYTKSTELNLSIYKTIENSGPGVARNIGIEKARGEYITFIDNDDWIEYNTLEIIDDVLKNNKYDCVVYDYYLDNNNKLKKMNSVYGNFEYDIKKEDALKYIRNHTVCKIYKRDVIKNVKFPCMRRHEDIVFLSGALVKCKTFYYLKNNLYHYVQRKDSLSNNSVMGYETIKEANKLVKENYGEKYKECFVEKSIMDYLYNIVLIMLKSNENRQNIKQFIKNFNKNNVKWISYNIVNYVGKVKKIFLMSIYYNRLFLLWILVKLHSIMTRG